MLTGPAGTAQPIEAIAAQPDIAPLLERRAQHPLHLPPRRPRRPQRIPRPAMREQAPAAAGRERARRADHGRDRVDHPVAGRLRVEGVQFLETPPYPAPSPHPTNGQTPQKLQPDTRHVGRDPRLPGQGRTRHLNPYQEPLPVLRAAPAITARSANPQLSDQLHAKSLVLGRQVLKLLQGGTDQGDDKAGTVFRSDHWDSTNHMILETVPAHIQNAQTCIRPSTGHRVTMPGPWGAAPVSCWLTSSWP
jgi:hypothetical protein